MGLVQRYYQVDGSGSNSANDSKDWPGDPNANIMASGEKTSKISIMAPSGTVVQLNSGSYSAKIVIGASGIFDFDNPDIEIDSISFPAVVDIASQKQELEAYLDQFMFQISTSFVTCVTWNFTVTGNTQTIANIHAPEGDSYSWEYQESGVDTWNNSPLASHTSQILKIPLDNVNRNGNKYRCKINNKFYSAPVQLKLNNNNNNWTINYLDVDGYKTFSSIIQNNLISGVTINETTKTLGQVVADYINLLNNPFQGNSTLNNIIVNYIV